MRSNHGVHHGLNINHKTRVTKQNQVEHLSLSVKTVGKFDERLKNVGCVPVNHKLWGRYTLVWQRIMNKSCPHKLKWRLLFFATQKWEPMRNICAERFITKLKELVWLRSFVFHYMLPVESSASPENLDFGVFLRSLRYGECNASLHLFSSLLFMKKFNLKTSPNFGICNIERFFGHR